MPPSGTTSQLNQAEPTSQGDVIPEIGGICDTGSQYCSYTIWGCAILLIIGSILGIVAIRKYYTLKKLKEETQETRLTTATDIQKRLNELKREKEGLSRQLDKERQDWERERSEHVHRLSTKTQELQRKAEAEFQRYNQLLEIRVGQDPDFTNLNDSHRPERVLSDFKAACDNSRLDMLDTLEEELGAVTPEISLRVPSDIAMYCHNQALKLVQACDDRVAAGILAVAVGAQVDNGFLNEDDKGPGSLNKKQVVSAEEGQEYTDTGFSDMDDEGLVSLEKRQVVSADGQEYTNTGFSEGDDGGIVSMGKRQNVTLKEATRLEIRQELKHHSKDVAEKGLKSVVTGVMRKFNLPEKKDVEDFVEECARLTWYMVLQAVPISLLEATTGRPLDPNLFNLYAECSGVKGEPVAFTIWPAVVTGREGSPDFKILEKGMAFTVAK